MGCGTRRGRGGGRGMTSTRELRSAIIGLLGFAAAEEQVLLAASPPGESGSASDWAALPIVAHNTEFRAQQVERLRAIASGREPEEFAEVDHSSDPAYQGYAAHPAAQVARDSWRVAGELIDGVASVSADDLLDPSSVTSYCQRPSHLRAQAAARRLRSACPVTRRAVPSTTTSRPSDQ